MLILDILNTKLKDANFMQVKVFWMQSTFCPAVSFEIRDHQRSEAVFIHEKFVNGKPAMHVW
jgi:hypothetical protein